MFCGHRLDPVDGEDAKHGVPVQQSRDRIGSLIADTLTLSRASETVKDLN
ncbi:hypothetical protein ACFQJ7_05160 [Halovenus rubra]|uniref:Uncharacterized protein n=2 Tax=Halovenus rubra TaxID=869890 RepID=A0ACC7E176_9EURY|nr:hypothetical protein [Halovenus rubra]